MFIFIHVLLVSGDIHGLHDKTMIVEIIHSCFMVFKDRFNRSFEYFSCTNFIKLKDESRVEFVIQVFSWWAIAPTSMFIWAQRTLCYVTSSFIRFDVYHAQFRQFSLPSCKTAIFEDFEALKNVVSCLSQTEQLFRITFCPTKYSKNLLKLRDDHSIWNCKFLINNRSIIKLIQAPLP